MFAQSPLRCYCCCPRTIDISINRGRNKSVPVLIWVTNENEWIRRRNIYVSRRIRTINRQRISETLCGYFHLFAVVIGAHSRPPPPSPPPMELTICYVCIAHLTRKKQSRARRTYTHEWIKNKRKKMNHLRTYDSFSLSLSHSRRSSLRDVYQAEDHGPELNY